MFSSVTVNESVFCFSEVVKAQHDGIYEGAFNHTGIALLEVFVLMTGNITLISSKFCLGFVA